LVTYCVYVIVVSVANASTEKKSGTTYISIAGGVGGGVFLIVIACIIIVLLFIRKHKRKDHYIDNQKTCPMTNTVTSKLNPAYKESEFMESCKTPSSFQYDMTDSNTKLDESPRYDNVRVNRNAAREYEIAESQSKEKEIEEYYLDMKPVGEYPTEEPLYDTIQEYSNKDEAIYENSETRYMTRYQRSLPANFKLKSTNNPKP